MLQRKVRRRKSRMKEIEKRSNFRKSEFIPARLSMRLAPKWNQQQQGGKRDEMVHCECRL